MITTTVEKAVLAENVLDDDGSALRSFPGIWQCLPFLIHYIFSCRKKGIKK